jgi:acetyl esterase/lipase
MPIGYLVTMAVLAGSALVAVASSPHDYVHAAAPPVFMAHGDNDTIVLVDDARAFAGKLGAVSASPVVYAELPGAQHGFDVFRSARCEAVVDAIEVYVARATGSSTRDSIASTSGGSTHRTRCHRDRP